ncbi:MAG: hypothetical protein ACRC3B_13365 [Bacteroidia bacterium]
MGYIKEPKGVDFIIQSGPLTPEFQQEISEFIKNYRNKKAKTTVKTGSAKKTRKTN